MKEITVTYLLTEDELERLEKITEAYREKGLDLSPEKQFEAIMTTGSKFDMDSKFYYHEKVLGLK